MKKSIFFVNLIKWSEPSEYFWLNDVCKQKKRRNNETDQQVIKLGNKEYGI